MMKEQWNGFKKGAWTNEINVSDFIKKNYVSYDGDESFLVEKTDKTSIIAETPRSLGINTGILPIVSCVLALTAT